MSQIKSADTLPEIKLRKLLFKTGILGYRVNSKLPGKPDLVFPKKRLVVFIDGCFWHKCPTHFVQPGTNKKFWQEKISKNVERDRKVNRILKKTGWKIVRFWEHDIKKDINSCVDIISKKVRK